MNWSRSGAEPRLRPPATDSPPRRPSGAGRGRRLAVAGLLAVAVTWGVSFSLVKSAVTTIPPASLVSWRFLLAAALLVLLRPRAVSSLPRRTIIRSAVAGGLLGGGFWLSTLGLQTTSVVVSAFVTGTTVVFAPLVAWIWLGRRLSGRTAGAVALAVSGLALVTLRGVTVDLGTGLIVGAAVLWAVHLVALERWTSPPEVYGSAVVQMVSAAGLATLLAGLLETGPGGPVPLTAALQLLALGGLATGAAFAVLTWAQARVDATTAAVLLTLEPVTGALTGMARGETLTLPVAAGSVAMLAAAFLVARAATSRRTPRRAAGEP